MQGTIFDAVKADPADDLAWLALADWLEEERQAGPAELHRLLLGLRRPDPGPDAAASRPAREERLRRLLASGVRPAVPTHELSLGQGLRLRLALIPPGQFWMGSPDAEPGRHTDEGPRRPVAITRPFYLGVVPVTQTQWRRLLGSTMNRFEGDDRPADGVTWLGGQDFCQRVAQKSGRAVRLPTEAEWEYACRAGTSTAYHFGHGLTSRLANYDARETLPGGRRGTFRRHTMNVASFPPNAFGLHDMHGNVGEWVADCYDPQFYARAIDREVGCLSGQVAERDPRCFLGRGEVLLRGGGWRDGPAECRSAARSLYGYAWQSGCRVLMEA